MTITVWEIMGDIGKSMQNWCGKLIWNIHGDLVRHSLLKYCTRLVVTKFDDCGTEFDKLGTKYNPEVIKYRP